jgi:hypothetical protein
MDPGVLSRRRPRLRVLAWLALAASRCVSPAASGRTPSSLNFLQPPLSARAVGIRGAFTY